METDELTALLRQVAGGDRQALGEFVRQVQGDVWRLCRALLPAEAAEDATQEVFLRVWKSAPSFRAESAVRTWVFTITKRTCYDALRRQQRWDATLTARSGIVTEDPGRLLVLQDLVDRLDPDRRTAFVLTQLQGFSYQEVADICGCRLGTVRSRVARARAQLLADGAAEQTWSAMRPPHG